MGILSPGFRYSLPCYSISHMPKFWSVHEVNRDKRVTTWFKTSLGKLNMINKNQPPALLCSIQGHVGYTLMKYHIESGKVYPKLPNCLGNLLYNNNPSDVPQNNILIFTENER